MAYKEITDFQAKKAYQTLLNYREQCIERLDAADGYIKRSKYGSSINGEKKVMDINLSTRCSNAIFSRCGYLLGLKYPEVTLHHVSTIGKKDWYKQRNVGFRTISEIQNLLEANGLKMHNNSTYLSEKQIR